MPLSGKVVAVTGGNGTLGRAVAAAALEQHATVALLDLAFGPGLPRFGSGRISAHAVDLLDTAAARACFAGIGRIHALCNVAGGFSMGPAVHETDAVLWQRMFDVNVTTLLNSVRAVVPGMLAQGGGKIVNVGARSGLKGLARMGAYCAAKATVIRLTESLSAELKASNINVNCVLPSIIDTPANRADMPEADVSRWVAPAALAEVICFLASDAASAIHGAAIPVDHLA
jgi:NAD(P)-dependent dehydrogenase (short-subunit alcohol dehydrogenase family)